MTDRSRSLLHPLRPTRGWSVRARITAAISALVLVALTAAGALMWLIGNVLIDQRLARDADQELAEFANLQRIGIDPDTGRRITSVDRLVRLYLERNVPSTSELLVGYWDGRTRLTSASERRDLTTDPRFVDVVSDRAATGGSEGIDTQWGEVHVDVLPLRDAQVDDGAFVVALFVSDEQAELRELLRTYAVVGALALALVTMAAYLVAGRLLSPLRALRDAAREISETDLSRRVPERGNDDLTELTRTVNQMLARLQAAFAGQRAFLDDAGHELRTPLTILQGHLELLDSEDPEEVARTRELLLDEVDRMSRLVEDLILLTKADRPGSLSFAPTDIADLTASVQEKATVMGDRDWRLEATADINAEVDEQRLTQALLQLVHNAVRHTEDGGTIALGSAYDQARDVVRLWVADDGPGVPVAWRERIFERFARVGETDGAAEPGDGFGLGLSIVSAIVEGHGGTVTVRDADGGGALFEIELPRERTTPWRES